MCGFCDVTQSVSSPAPDMYCASAARLMALGMSRWLMMRSFTTTSADRNASQPAAHPQRHGARAALAQWNSPARES